LQIVAFERGHDGFGLKSSPACSLLLGIFPDSPACRIASLRCSSASAREWRVERDAAFKLTKRGWGWVLFDGILSIVIAFDRQRQPAGLDQLRRRPGRHRDDLRRRQSCLDGCCAGGVSPSGPSVSNPV
jgi:hypothetical protein